jgi:putative lipoprotein
MMCTVNPMSRFSALVLCVALSACQTAAPSGAARSPADAPASLSGTSWVAEDIDGGGVLEAVRSTLTFESDERIVGSTGCNHYFVPIELSGTTLRSGPIGSTRRACPPPVMSQEQLFLRALSAVTAFRQEDRTLFLVDATDRVRVRLTRALERAEAARAFDCQEGPAFVLVPVLGGDAALELDRDVRRLTRQVTASGARYSDGKVTVWNEGREARLELGGQRYRCIESRPRSIRADARLRGVDFRATGNEPGWSLEMLQDRIVFLDQGGARVTAPRPAPQVDPASGETVYAAETDGHRIRVLIRASECIDSMSGERSESSVAVEIDGRAYRGCGYALP